MFQAVRKTARNRAPWLSCSRAKPPHQTPPERRPRGLGYLHHRTNILPLERHTAGVRYLYRIAELFHDAEELFFPKNTGPHGKPTITTPVTTPVNNCGTFVGN